MNFFVWHPNNPIQSEKGFGFRYSHAAMSAMLITLGATQLEPPGGEI